MLTPGGYRRNVLILIPGLAVFATIAILIIRRKRRLRTADDVIYLGYDDQDGVSSMHSALLERIRNGDLDR